MYNFDEHISRLNTSAVKTEIDCDGRPLPEDVLSMWIADMDISCAPPIIEAIKRTADRRIFGYTRFGEKPFLDALTSFYSRRHGWGINTEELVFSCGVVSALEAAVSALSGEGDGVIIQPPVYAPFKRTVDKYRRTLIENPLIKLPGGSYEMDFGDLEKKAALPGAKLMILCSPHNPAGRVWSEAELRRVYEICSKNKIVLISDEIHCDLGRGEVKNTALLRLFPRAQDIVVCCAPTKSFNIAGMGVSFSVCPSSELREKLRFAIGECLINPISIAAATAAYAECEDWLDELKAYIDGNFAYLRQLLAERLPEAKMAPTEGTYLAWVDFSAYRADSLAFERELIEKGRLSLEAGARFGTGGEGFMRICLACPRDFIKDAVERIVRTLEL
ncbi:MAG: PatB family C-S lyase [Oscillospiraceae bacterium]|nr:PatB family C-S lyase [Oscillospiraceae bacterium]